MAQAQSPVSAKHPENFKHLRERLSEAHLDQRLQQQAKHNARLSHQGEGFFRIERYIAIDELAKWGLRSVFLWKRGHANIFDIEIVEQEWHFPKLPKNFDGFRLLHLSDLHIDINPALNRAVVEAIKDCPHDAMVMTGDYRDSTDDNYGASMDLMEPILEASEAPRFGILGNHDCIEMVWELEARRLPILLNEASSIERDGEQLHLAGVDDPHFYRTHDFAKAREKVPDGAFSVLLCHSPEAHAEAASHGFDFMLSGHTHAGQICLPGGRHVVLPVKNLSHDLIKGRWTSGRMQGYTSRGTGSSGVAARFNCRPEVTVHTLRRA
ncbi:MAG: metallophosphoesterase [Opitutales bacterium]